MPYLGDDLRAQRRQYVLTCAWRCFSLNGFHATSMDDIIAATGMSSSAVYRYVSGKDELVSAASEQALTLLRDFFARLLAAEPLPSPAETVSALVSELSTRTNNDGYDLSKIAMHAWAEALRRPDLKTRTRAFYRDVRTNLVALARRWQAAGMLAPGAKPEQVATVLLTLMPGLIVNRHLVDPIAADALFDGLTALATVPADV
jgi:AcrR family transcriptional regulator